MKKLATLIIASVFLLGCVTVSNNNRETELISKKSKNTDKVITYQSVTAEIPIFITLSATKNAAFKDLTLKFRSSHINLFQIKKEDLLSGNFSGRSSSLIFINMHEDHPYNLQYISGKKMTIRKSIKPKTNAPINFIQFNVGYGQFWYFDNEDEIMAESKYFPDGDMQGNTIYFIDKQALSEPFYITRAEFGDSKDDSGLVIDREIPSYIKKVMESIEGGGALFLPFDSIQTDWNGAAYELNISLDIEKLFESESILNDHIAGTPLDLSVSFNEINENDYLSDYEEGKWYFQ